MTIVEEYLTNYTKRELITIRDSFKPGLVPDYIVAAIAIKEEEGL